MVGAEKSRLSILRAANLIMMNENKIPTMREIAVRADMGLGSLYYHFNSLDQIFMELDGLTYEHMIGITRERLIMDKSFQDSRDNPGDSSLILFMAVETFRSLFLLSHEVYVKRFMTQPLWVTFQEKRLFGIESMLDSLWQRSDDYDIYSYLGLYTAFFAKMTAREGMSRVYDGMERLFFSFFQDYLDLWAVSDSFGRVKDLGQIITRGELALPWVYAQKTEVEIKMDSRSIGSFDQEPARLDTAGIYRK